MKKPLLILLILSLIHLGSWAQLSQNRSTSTKIADLLALQPADKPEQLGHAMLQLEQFTSTDFSMLLGGLKAEGSTENTAIQYAANSYSFHVANQDKSLRQVFNEGVLTALAQTRDTTQARFFLQLLQRTADEQHIPQLLPYLTDPTRFQSTTHVLAQLGSHTAGAALLSALKDADQEDMKVAYVQALGQMAYAPAEDELLRVHHGRLKNKEAVTLQKSILTALSRIGGSGSRSVLAEEAKKAAYQYEETGATAALLHYIPVLSQNGGKTQAIQLAKQVYRLRNLAPETKAHVLSILVELEGEKQLDQVLKAARDPQPALRETALSLLSSIQTDQGPNKLLRNLHREPTGVQISILRYLGDQSIHEGLPAVQRALENGPSELRAAAAKSLYQLVGEESVPALLSQLSHDSTLSEAIIQLLLSSRAPELETQTHQRLEHEQDDSAKIYLLNLIAARNFERAGSTVMQIATAATESSAVKAAAIQALAHIAQAEQLEELLNLVSYLPEEDHKEPDSKADLIRAAQHAISRAVIHSQDPSSILAHIHQHNFLKQSPAIQKRYFPVFAQTADPKILKHVENLAIGNGNQALQIPAISALAQWNNSDALPALIQISKKQNEQQGVIRAPVMDELVRGIIRQVGESNLAAEQKTLILRDLFTQVSSTADQRRIISALAATNTFQAIVFAGQYLEDEHLKSAAAQTIMGIALDNPQFDGKEVTDLLEKVSGVLSGSESGYLREAIRKHVDAMPSDAGWVSLFNGKNLDGWKGLVANPIRRSRMDAETLATEQQKADEIMRGGWYVENGELHFNGQGDNIATTKDYGDFEMHVDWKLAADGEEGDAGIYLRGTPQVQVWDISRTNVGAEVGSGGLYNNQKHPSKPLSVEDNALGDWNTFYIKMVGDRVSVYLNGVLVTDQVVLENYWDRSQPIFPIEQIELQAHGTHVSYRDIYIRELPRQEPYEMSEEEKAEGFQVLFDGTSLDQWTGNTDDYVISDEHTLAVYPKDGSGGNLYTKEQFGDFVFRFSFRLTPGANNGVGIRTPLEGDAAYVGMEIQVLDDTAEIYRNLEDWQYHGSVYGIIAARRGHLKPLGEWNEEEIYIQGDHIRVTLNGVVIVDGNLSEATKNGTLDGKVHPGLQNDSGHIGFLGHGSEVHFKNIRVRRL